MTNIVIDNTFEELIKKVAANAYGAGVIQACADMSGQSVAPYTWQGTFAGWWEQEGKKILAGKTTEK